MKCTEIKLRTQREIQYYAVVNVPLREGKHSTISGDNSEGAPPVLIPNTEVKPFNAESTWLDTAREDRKSPDFLTLKITSQENGHKRCKPAFKA